MSKNKNILRIENPFEDVRVIGIATPLLDYKLAGSINNILGINLVKEKSLVAKNFDDTPFSFYFFYDEEKENTYNLVSLQSGNKSWICPETKIDFLLLIRDLKSNPQLKAITENINEIKQIFFAFVIDVNKNKAFHPILEEIEFHDFAITKEKTC